MPKRRASTSVASAADWAEADPKLLSGLGITTTTGPARTDQQPARAHSRLTDRKTVALARERAALASGKDGEAARFADLAMEPDAARG